MTRDPFRRPPMVDLPIAPGESIYRRFSNAMDRMVEAVEAYERAEPWFLGRLREKLDEAGTCPRCGCPPDRYCGCTPDACGCTPPNPPNPDDPIGPDASDGRFGDGSHDMPPPAAPYAPRGATDAGGEPWETGDAQGVPWADTVPYEGGVAGSAGERPWWYPADTSGLSYAEATDLATRAGELRDEHVRQGDSQDVVDRAEGTYQQALQAQREAGHRMDQRRRLEIKRTGRWYDENPITSTNTTPTGGSGMSIGDARQGMLGPIEKLNEALGAIQSGHAALEEAQAGLRQATEGSNQAEADQAHAQVVESLNKVDEAQQQIAQALQEFEGVAQRL